MAEDRTFSANDVLRIYCNHLTDWEKDKVAEWFRDTDGDCFDLPDLDIDVEDLLDQAKNVGNLIVIVADKLSLLGAFLTGYIFGDDEAIPEPVEGIEEIINNNAESKTATTIKEIGATYDDVIAEVIKERSLTDDEKRAILEVWQAEKEKAFEKQKDILAGIYIWNTLVPEQWELDMQETIQDYATGINAIYDSMAEYQLIVEQINKALGLEKEDGSN